MVSSNDFAGDFLPFSRKLAVWGVSSLVKARSRSPFIASFEATPCVIVPVVEADRIALTVFYGTLRRLSVARLADGDLSQIIAHWRNYSRAFVQCELTPTLKALDHNATRNAAKALSRAEIWVQTPSLSEIDEALCTSLEPLHSASYEKLREVGHALTQLA